jgi:ribokinase
MYDVICIGSATVDVFAKTKFSELIKIHGSEGITSLLAYPTGAKILIEQLEFTTGGGATNTAVSFARLGHKVACISKIGCKGNAERVRSDLKKEKVDASLLVCSNKGRTGYSIILDSLEHDRTILAFKGSNNDLRFNEIKKNKLKTKWFYFGTMMNESYKTLEKLADYAQKNNIKIAFNTSEYLAKKGAKFLKKVLSKTTLLVLNKEEAHLIAGGGTEKELLEKLHNLGPKTVVITDGKKGAHASDGKDIFFLKPNSIKVVETTGAGDAFASTLLSGLIKKNDMEFALQLASANAESVISYHGAKNKLLTFKEVLKVIKKRPSKIQKNL